MHTAHYCAVQKNSSMNSHYISLLKKCSCMRYVFYSHSIAQRTAVVLPKMKIYFPFLTHSVRVRQLNEFVSLQSSSQCNNSSGWRGAAEERQGPGGRGTLPCQGAKQQHVFLPIEVIKCDKISLFRTCFTGKDVVCDN